jgi:hypothetical protein
MDKFVEKYQPELYEMWKMGIDVESRNEELRIINRNDLQPKRKRPSISDKILPTNTTANKRPRLASISTESSPPNQQLEEYMRQARAQYSQLEFSSFTDSPQRRHQIDERNIALAGQGSRLYHLSATQLDAALKFLPSLRASSLLKLAFIKLVYSRLYISII